MFDLSDLCLRLLRALTAGPVAWLTPAQLIARSGAPRGPAYDALADLDASGWLEPWETDGELYVTLTPRAAERLRVRLAPAGRSETYRWVPVDAPEPCPRAPNPGQGEVDALDLIPDPAPGPDVEAEAAERMERMIARNAQPPGPSASSFPKPTILLGSGLTPWPGPAEAAAGPCPACHSEPISGRAYCLVCDRWGLDNLLHGPSAPPRPPIRPRRPTPNAPRDDAGAAAAKAARRAKHRRKLAEREAQQRARRNLPG